jgi:DNA polymerase-4
MSPRKILHLDLDAFFCAVEEQLYPSLQGKPFAVGGQPGQRGVVASCSYAARMYGIHSAMPMSRAVKLCPQLIIVHGKYERYSEASHKVMEIINQLTPLVEQISVDEAFLDVSDLPQSGYQIAIELQARIDTELGLPCSIGVATNKLLAKIANNMGKSENKGPNPPRAIKVVSPGKEAEFLAPLPARSLWGIGPKTAQRLEELDIHTIGEIAQQSESFLIHHFGKYGLSLYKHSRGINGGPIETEHETKSISQEVTFARDVSDPVELRKSLLRMSESVGRRLRKHDFQCTTIRIKLRWPDFTTITRQVTMQEPVDQDRVIFVAACELFNKYWTPGKPVRLLGVGVSGLTSRAVQLSLWETENERERRLLKALDDLHERFGRDSVQRGSFLKGPKKRK